MKRTEARQTVPRAQISTVVLVVAVKPTDDCFTVNPRGPAETLVGFMTPPSPRLRRPEEETPAGRAGDREPASGQAALPGRLLQSQRGALPQHPLRPRPQGAPPQKLQDPEDGPGRHEGRGGRERCPNETLSVCLSKQNDF